MFEIKITLVDKNKIRNNEFKIGDEIVLKTIDDVNYYGTLIIIDLNLNSIIIESKGFITPDNKFLKLNTRMGCKLDEIKELCIFNPSFEEWIKELELTE